MEGNSRRLGPIARVIRADRHRKTRFHDEKGQLVGPIGMLYAPRAFTEAMLRRTSGYHPAVPWLCYHAIKPVESLINRDSRVLEFGSGMSTVWFAQRCRFVHSIEHEPQWHEYIRSLLGRKHLTNVRLELRTSDYAELSAYPDGTIDFVLVDGLEREKCVDAALAKVRPGGSIYLDNSDKVGVRPAETRLLRAVAERGGTVRTFLGFCPATPTVIEGTLATL